MGGRELFWNKNSYQTCDSVKSKSVSGLTLRKDVSGPVSDLRCLLKFCFPAFAPQGSRWTDGATEETCNLRRLISLLQHNRLDKTASHFTDGSALSPACHSLRFQLSRPEAWTRGWRGMSRDYHDKHKHRNSDTAPFGTGFGLVQGLWGTWFTRRLGEAEDGSLLTMR